MKLLLLICFAMSAQARLEWPGTAKDGEYCGAEYPPGFHCVEGLACDRRGSEDPYGGICRKPCREDSECKRNQACNKDETVGFCWEVS